MTSTVESVMSKKVVTIDPNASLFDAAREIMNHDIGCVIVLGGGKVEGIITKGDILRESIMKKLDPQRVSVGSVMSKPVLTARQSETLADASALMSKNNVTKLPVVGEKGELVGVVTSTDIIRRHQPRKLARDMV